MGLQYFVVRTKQARETVAACSIASEGFSTFLPVVLVDRTHRGKRERVARPLFPRYLFVQFDKSLPGFWKINYCRGAAASRALMCDADDKPLAVPDSVIENIRERERLTLAKAGEVKTGYAPGDTFPIQVGEWAQFIGTYIGEAKGEVWASIGLFGRAHIIRLPFEAVPLFEKLFDRKSA